MRAMTGPTDKASDKSSDRGDAPEATLPPLDFAGFVLSLASSAMVNLGSLPDGATAEGGHVDLPAAKQIIDILALLEEKTRGNLDPNEARMLTSLLYDLRVQFVDARKRAG
jgi:hypothetical protein